MFLLAGAACFALRRRTEGPGIFGGGLLDALGTLCWAGLLTVLVGLLLRTTAWWRPGTWIVALAVSLADEFLQATSWPARLQEAFPPAHLIFGSTFSWTDLLWYPVDVAVAWILLRRKPPRPADRQGTG